EEGRKLQEDRYSKGTANVYAAHSSIKAEPEPSKFVTAADQLIDSAKTALPIPKVEDLQGALAIKDKLISERGEVIKEGQSERQKQRETILAAKNKEAELQAEQEKLKATAKAKEKELIAQIEIKESQLEKERLAWAIKAEKDAAKWRYENVWYRKYNPLRHLGNFFSSILFWVIFVLVGGLILKILSVIFPSVSVIQSVVRG